MLMMMCVSCEKLKSKSVLITVVIILFHVLMIHQNLCFQYVFIKWNDNKYVTVKGYRDSGAAVTLLMEGLYPMIS